VTLDDDALYHLGCLDIEPEHVLWSSREIELETN
jgi:hypothetical protein